MPFAIAEAAARFIRRCSWGSALFGGRCLLHFVCWKTRKDSTNDGPMISFMISVVPPKIDQTRLSRQSRNRAGEHRQFCWHLGQTVMVDVGHILRGEGQYLLSHVWAPWNVL